MEKFHNLYPNIEISIVSRSTTELLKLLESHEIDFIIDSSPIDPIFDNLIIKPLTVVPNCFVARTDSKIIPKKVMKQISDIKDLPLILPVRRSTHRKELEKVAFEANIQFSNVISIETSEMIIGAVEKDLGIAYVIYDLVKKDIESGILRKIDIKEKLPTITINLVYIEKFLTRVPLKFIEKFLTTDIKETVTEK
jgi:DNA-binding transcriptional LysR family regulator